MQHEHLIGAVPHLVDHYAEVIIIGTRVEGEVGSPRGLR
jgi:hypothetical protein